MSSEIAGPSNHPTTRSSLPIDIIFEIVKYLGTKRLRGLATVSSAWVSITRSIAFEDITVNSEDPEFFALVKSPHCTFPLHVRKLRFHKRTKAFETMATEIAKTLEVLPNVTWLAFQNCTRVFGPYTGPRAVFEQIRGLELEIHLDLAREAEFFAQFLSWFPRICRLDSSRSKCPLWSTSIDPDRDFSVNPSRGRRRTVSRRLKPTELFLHDRDRHVYLPDEEPEMIHALVSLTCVQKVTVQLDYHGPFTLRGTDVIMKKIAGSLEYLTLDLPFTSSGRSVNLIVEHNPNLHTLELQAKEYGCGVLLSVLEKITIRRLRTLILRPNSVSCEGVYTVLTEALDILTKRRDVFGQLERVVYDVHLFLEVPYDRSGVDRTWARCKGEDWFAGVELEMKLRLTERLVGSGGWYIHTRLDDLR